jgi:NAD(P)-dependent dehydrogenase (short-subunit alcohol dehydrogenase family)
MKDSALRLQDKTILLVGPFNGVTQACMRTLTEFGCDVAFVSDQTPNASRYVDGINEAREVHANYGRAGFFNMPLKTEAQVMEALGRVTESLGRVDALVDATPLSWDGSTGESVIDICVLLAEKCLPFLLAKHRGRIVYLFEDTCLEEIVPTTNTSGFRDILNEKIVDLAKKYSQKNVTVNGLSIGVTDDFILKTYPKSGSIKKSMEELQKTYPSARLVETHDVALGVAYLASALSGSVTGQVLRLTQGFHL